MALENIKNNNPGMVEEIEKNIPDFAKGKNTTKNDSMESNVNEGEYNTTYTEDKKGQNTANDNTSLNNKKR